MTWNISKQLIGRQTGTYLQPYETFTMKLFPKKTDKFTKNKFRLNENISKIKGNENVDIYVAQVFFIVENSKMV